MIMKEQIGAFLLIVFSLPRILLSLSILSLPRIHLSLHRPFLSPYYLFRVGTETIISFQPEANDRIDLVDHDLISLHPVVNEFGSMDPVDQDLTTSNVSSSSRSATL